MWSHDQFCLWLPRNKGWLNFPTGSNHPTLPYRADPGLRTISKIYKGLHELCGVNTSYIEEKWKREVNFVMSLEEWENLNDKQWKSTYTLSWREFGWEKSGQIFYNTST